MHKKVFFIGLILFLVLIISCQRTSGTGTGGISASGEREGNLVIWSLLGNFYTNGGIADQYQRMHPKVTYEFMNFQSDDLFLRLQQTLASGGDLPDVMDYESGWWKRANDMDLKIHLQNHGVSTSDYMDFAVPGMLDSNGNIQGINYALNFGAIAIKTDMARRYLGTDNRDEIIQMFSTLDRMIETGQRVRAETNNRINLFGSWLFFNFWFNFRTGFANENAAGELEFTRNHLPVYQNQLRIWRSGIVTNNAPGSPAYNAQMTDDVNIAMMTATGDIFYTFLPNDPEGRVSLMLIPLPADIGGFQLGGTSIGVMKTSRVPDLAIDFVKYFLHDVEGVRWVRDNLGSFVPLKAAADLGPYTFQNFGNFDYGGFYMSLGPTVPPIPYSLHDPVVSQAIAVAQQEMLVNPTITAEQLLQIQIDEVRARLPNVVIR